ncbi:MAG: alpha/beta fold hydrolase [Solirubrobacteraceae bacterium]
MAEGNVSLDSLLSDAGGGATRRWFPGVAGAKLAAKLATRPWKVARRGLGYSGELAKIAIGQSDVAPSKKDRRFKDEAWRGNPAFRRLAQVYLAAGKTVDELISDADLDERAERRVRFAAENVLDALAPTNFPALNPAALKVTLDTGGKNLAQGTANLVHDLSRRPHIPAMVDDSAFTVGEDLALSPGAVVLRTELFELIQYEPSTPKVRATALLLVPPMINKFYIADIAPGRSMLEHFVGSGQQCFTISWRNPDERHADWGLDDYVTAVLESLDALEAITGSSRSHIMGLCAGGITASCAVGHLAAKGDLDRIAGLALGVCVLDNANAGTVGALVDRPTAAAALAESQRKGYLDGRALAGVFAWLRPNDLVWNYWVNNYLLGKDPPAFDVLYWNADSTNLPAGLHRDFMELSLANDLVRPGERVVLDTPIDLSKITVDSYQVAGISDHITPWQSNYRSTHLLGSDPRFVLSTSGHIAALVNPPGNEKASYQINGANPPDAEAWLREATTHRGTWWDDYVAWLGERSGPEKPARKKLGGKGYKPLDPAPGIYVLG